MKRRLTIARGLVNRPELLLLGEIAWGQLRGGTYSAVWLQWVVEATPLYRGVVLCRELTTGQVTWDSAISVVYLVAMGLVGVAVVRRRLDVLLLT